MSIVRLPGSSNTLSRAVVADGRVYISGSTAASAGPDAKSQTAAILKEIDRRLADAGSDKSRLLSANVFVSDMRVSAGMNEAWLAWADPKNLPARATVETRLGKPEILVEIMTVAALSPAASQTRLDPGDRFSRAVVADGRVYLAGHTAPEAGLDARSQTAAILKEIDRRLASAGSDKSRLLSVNVFVSDMRAKTAMDEAWLAWVDPKNLPARATVETRLGKPEVLVEIMAVAAAPASRQGAADATGITRTNPMGKLCDMVEYDGMLYLAGQVSEDLKLDAKGQTESILKQIDDLLKGAGSSKSKLLSATVYVSDMRDKPKMDEAWLKWVDPKNLPARATVEARLGSPDTLVEIMCVAAK